MSENRLKWEEFYMGIALVASQRSPVGQMKVGAVVVGEHKNILGVGYNGCPKGQDYVEDNTDNILIHAEINAILHSSGSVRDGKIYTTLYPCWQCARAIVQSGIKEVVYLQVKDDEGNGKIFQLEKSREIFKDTSVKPFYEKCKREKISRAYDNIEILSQPSTSQPCGDQSKELKLILNFISWDHNSKKKLNVKEEKEMPKLSNDDFMKAALDASKKSKHPATSCKGGAAVVSKNNRIMAQEDDYYIDKYCCHAVLKAIVHANSSRKGATIFTRFFPCLQCVQFIINEEIAKVVYFEEVVITYSADDKNNFLEGKTLLNEKKIPSELFKSDVFKTLSQVNIDEIKQKRNDAEVIKIIDE